MQEVRWDSGGTVRAGIIIFLWKRKRKSSTGNRIFFVHDRIVSAIKRVEFASERLSYIVMRVRWCNIITQKVYAPSEEKSVDSNDSFYEELVQVFLSFS